jgi:electron transport complex protein RnfC
MGRALLEEVKKRDVATVVPATVTLVQVGSRYPQRRQCEMEGALRKYERKTLDSLGALIFVGPAELAAVYDAVTLHKPLLSRYVAVGGSAVRHPAVINARIGTRAGELFQQCGGFKKEPEYIGFGSALLGQKVSPPDLAGLNEPVTKTTYAVFAESASPFSFLRKIPFVKHGWQWPQATASCINCGLCRTVCPLGLDPADLYKQLMAMAYDEVYSYFIAQCHGCACCEAVCPSRLPLCTAIKGFASSVSSLYSRLTEDAG